jgi:hypothetical protein
MAHPYSSTVDGGDFDAVQADGVRAMGRARAEDALLCPGEVPAWVYAQNVTTCAIEPGDDKDLIAGLKAPATFEHLRLEHQPGFGCAFVGLQRC